MNLFSIFLVISAPAFFEGPACHVDSIPVTRGIGKVYLLPDGKIKGYILGINDSSIDIIQRKYWNSGLLSQKRSIPVNKISVITKTSRSKYSSLEGMATGAIGGMILGFAIGFSDCDDPDDDCGFFQQLFTPGSLKKAFTVGVVLGGIASVAGLFSRGKRKRKFYINGSRDTFLINKNEILNY